MHLAREIAPIRKPNCDGLRAERFADIDHTQVVVDRVSTNVGICMTERAKLVGYRLIRLILESVRVDGVESEIQRGRVVA